MMTTTNTRAMVEALRTLADRLETVEGPIRMGCTFSFHGANTLELFKRIEHVLNADMERIDDTGCFWVRSEYGDCIYINCFVDRDTFNQLEDIPCK